MKSLEKSSLFDMVLGEAGADVGRIHRKHPIRTARDGIYKLNTICQFSFTIADMLALLHGKHKPRKELKTKRINKLIAQTRSFLQNEINFFVF
jgi:hypothetical protein